MSLRDDMWLVRAALGDMTDDVSAALVNVFAAAIDTDTAQEDTRHQARLRQAAERRVVELDAALHDIGSEG